MKTKLFKNTQEKVIFLVSFFTALIFFIWQRHFISWDFSTYIMNAEYMFGGHYIEWLRPPFVPFLFLIFKPLGRVLASYVFAIFCTLLYFFSLKLFHDKFLKNVGNSGVFYLFAINPFILTYGLGMGSELLSLSLVILFVTFAFSASSSLFLGLSMLARYSNIVLLPLIFVSKNIKKILAAILVIFLVFLPWLAINFVSTSHALTSLWDYYALNSLEQAHAHPELQKLSLHLLLAINICLPFLLLGIFAKLKNKCGDKSEDKAKGINKKLSILLLLLALFTLLVYELNPSKDLRFLFNLALPICYFSVLGFSFIFEKIRNNKKVIISLVLCVLLIFSFFSSFLLLEKFSIGFVRDETLVRQIMPKLDNCTVSSDLWVYFDWYGTKARSEPKDLNLVETGKPEIFKMIEDGYNIILFKNSEAFSKNNESIGQLRDYVVEDTNEYVWLHKKGSCREDSRINTTYIDSLKPFGEFPQEFSGCNALLLKLKLENVCRRLKFL